MTVFCRFFLLLFWWRDILKTKQSFTLTISQGQVINWPNRKKIFLSYILKKKKVFCMISWTLNFFEDLLAARGCYFNVSVIQNSECCRVIQHIGDLGTNVNRGSKRRRNEYAVQRWIRFESGFYYLIWAVLFCDISLDHLHLVRMSYIKQKILMAKYVVNPFTKLV